jgi:hypothetical protein
MGRLTDEMPRLPYTPSHSALNIALDFEGSLMDVDASGHRWIKELAVRAGRNWELAQHVGTCITFDGSKAEVAARWQGQLPARTLQGVATQEASI